MELKKSPKISRYIFNTQNKIYNTSNITDTSFRINKKLQLTASPLVRQVPAVVLQITHSSQRDAPIGEALVLLIGASDRWLGAHSVIVLVRAVPTIVLPIAHVPHWDAAVVAALKLVAHVA